MAQQPIDPTPKQPDIEQPVTPEAPAPGGQPAKPFELGAGQTSEGMKLAMKHYLNSDMPAKWTDSSTGAQYTAKTGKDANPPAGEKEAQTVTLTETRNGQVVGEQQFAVTTTSTQNATVYSVYTKPGNEPVGGLDTLQFQRVPNNLGALMREDPKLGRKLYHSLLVGIAMKMMRDMRKKQGKLFKSD